MWYIEKIGLNHKIVFLKMKNKNSLLTSTARFRSILPLICIILIASALFIGLVLLIHFKYEIPIGKLTRDTTAIGKIPPYYGFLSQIGIFCWFESVAICIFSAVILSLEIDKLKFKSFFFISGFLTLLLGLDDAFLLHEKLLPALGFSEKVMFAIYAIVFLFYLIKFFPLILKTEYIIFTMAFLFFGISIALDVFDPHGINPYLFEDSAKLIGIISWLVYFFHTGLTVINK